MKHYAIEVAGPDGTTSLTKSNRGIGKGFRSHLESVGKRDKDCDLSPTIIESRKLMKRLTCPGAPDFDAHVKPKNMPPPESAGFPHYIKMIRHLNRKFSVAEIKVALEGCKADSAPGEDGIPYRALQLMDDGALGCLCEIYNASLSSGALPAQWPTACMQC